MPQRILLLLVAALLAAAAGSVAQAQAGSSGASPPRRVGPDYNKGRPLPLAGSLRQVMSAGAGSARTLATAAAPKDEEAREKDEKHKDHAGKDDEGESDEGQGPGGGDPGDAPAETRTWLAIDDLEQSVYPKDFTLRGIGDHVEVWVASGAGDVSTGLEFLPGDCRNDRVAVTDEQVDYLIAEFDDNIFPKESRAFSVPPERDGSNATAPGELGLPPDYYQGEGDNIVILVDNVRDANFHDLDNENGYPYIAGFFYSVFNESFDRNVITIDAFDWLHRIGADPPDDPVPGDFCENAPARPFFVEAQIAFEYQHLLQYYEDPFEALWVSEGLSSWAQTLTGYVDPSRSIEETGFDDRTQCFLGYGIVPTPANPNPLDAGGPENSLTAWGDQGFEEILCDYGATGTLMEFLAGRYGTRFMSALHRSDASGLEGLQETLNRFGRGARVAEVIHDWAAMVALDGVLDTGARLWGGRARDFQTPTLHASVNLSSPEAYSTPGAPPNGSDYVRLRDGSGTFLSARDIHSLSFDGAETLPPQPVEWEVDVDPPEHPGDAALRSGTASDLDRAIVREVAVPAGTPTLTFETLFDTEAGFDFGFVQVSADGGQTYTSLGNADTTSEADPGAIGTIHENLPGFNGASGGGPPAWIATSFDLSPYAGTTVLLAFRYVTDSIFEGTGWWIDDVRVGGVLVSDGTSLEGWRSPTEFLPTPIAGFTVQLVGYTPERSTPAFIARLRLNDDFEASLIRGPLRRFLGQQAEVVAAIVTYDEPTESVNEYAPYTLTVNGVTQPGG